MAQSTGRSAIPPNYSQRIKALRTRLGLTQARLADLLGVSFASVNRWENGQSRPTMLAWQKLMRAEQVGIEALGAEPVGQASAKQPEAEQEDTAPKIDFSAPADVVHAIAEAEHLSSGYMLNPTFATEISPVEPLPHQRIAVYKHMLPQPHLRFLLADDAGAGKTIMTGLYVREMLTRRLISRVLVVPPAGLVGNWEREMHTLFNLPFRIVAGSDARTGNPFVGADSHLLIVSVDTLADERMFARLTGHEVGPYDLVVFDEAHKLSADREPDFYVPKTDRYKLAEALVGAQGDDEQWTLSWGFPHVPLLTATPQPQPGPSAFPSPREGRITCDG